MYSSPFNTNVAVKVTFVFSVPWLTFPVAGSINSLLDDQVSVASNPSTLVGNTISFLANETDVEMLIELAAASNKSVTDNSENFKSPALTTWIWGLAAPYPNADIIPTNSNSPPTTAPDNFLLISSNSSAVILAGSTLNVVSYSPTIAITLYAFVATAALTKTAFPLTNEQWNGLTASKLVVSTFSNTLTV